MGAVVLDAGVVLAFLDPTDALTLPARRALGAARDRGDLFVLPATVLTESLIRTARLRPDRLDDAADRLVDLFGEERAVDRDVAVVAARLRAADAALRLPDALVVATGIVDDATVLTCDKRLARVDARVQVLGG